MKLCPMFSKTTNCTSLCELYDEPTQGCSIKAILAILRNTNEAANSQSNSAAHAAYELRVKNAADARKREQDRIDRAY